MPPSHTLQTLQKISQKNLSFRGPYIVIYSYNKTNEMHWFLKFIFGIELLHVLDRFSVHHQDHDGTSWFR
jgi:hypothetical protein